MAVDIKEDDKGITINGKLLTFEEVAAFMIYQDGKQRILVAPTNTIFLTLFIACYGLVHAAVSGVQQSIVDCFGKVLSATTDVLGLANLPKVKLKGFPRKTGLPQGGQSAADALIAFPTETHNAHLDADTLRSQAARLGIFFGLGVLLATAAQKVTRNAFPIAKALADSLRVLQKVVDPVLGTHPDLVTKLQGMLSYLKDPVVKGKRTRKANQRQAKKLTEKVQANTLPEARNQVRQEMHTQMEDTFNSVFVPEKVAK